MSTDGWPMSSTRTGGTTPHVELLQQVLSADVAAGGRFLDVGAGTGATGAWLADHGDLVASDFMPLALQLNRERHAASQRLDLVAADATELPFADGSFDLCLCVTVLCHQSIADPGDCGARAGPRGSTGWRRVPLGTGRPPPPSSPRPCHALGAPIRTCSDLSGLLERAGLAVERASGAYSFLVPPAAVKAALERGETASDLDRNAGGLGGTLSAAARVERSLLRHTDLPAGLSVFAVGRVPTASVRRGP